MSSAETKGRYIPLMIFGLLGLNVVVVGVTIYAAGSDASVAVEPNYYQKALAWDDTARQEQANQRLAWKAIAAVTGQAPGRSALHVNLVDSSAAPIRGATLSVEAFSFRRSGDRRILELTEVEPGVYTTDLVHESGGRWQLRLLARLGGETFTTVANVDIPTGAGG